MLRKNVSGQFVHLQGVDATTGGIKSGVTWTMRRCLDGTFAAGGATITEDGSTGWYKVALTQADTNGNDIGYNFTGTGAVPQTINAVTTAADPTDAVHFGLSALPNTACTGNASLLTSGTGTDQLSVASGLVNITQTAADKAWSTAARTLTAGTNIQLPSNGLANVTTWTVAITGNITGNLSGSVGSVTGAVGSVTGNVGGNVVGSCASVSGAVGSVTGAVGSVTGNVGGNVVGSCASVSGAVGSVTGNVGGNVTGSVGSVVGNVGGNVVGSVASVTTVSDKTGYALTSAYDFAKGTVAVTESYASEGAAPTPVQALMLIQQMLTEKAVASTTLTVKKIDGATSAAVFSLNDATSPTSITRSS